MKINFTLNFKKNKTIGMLILTCLLLLSSTLSFGQCGFDPTCSNTDYLNFGMGSTTNATTLEYDNFCSSFHSTAVRTSNGVYKVWGESSANDGAASLLSPTIVNVTNFPALTGNVLKVGLGSNYAGVSQRILLSTTGLFAWGVRGTVLHTSITPTTTFQKLTIDGQANGLPVGVNPSDVKMMFVTYQTIAITTCSGDVWVISQLGENTGTGLAGVLTAVQAAKWYKVTQSTAGNPSLDNVIAVRGQNRTLFALKSDGTLWTWERKRF